MAIEIIDSPPDIKSALSSSSVLSSSSSFRYSFSRIIDYNRPITIKDMDYASYASKFELVHIWQKTGNPELLIKIFRDVTTFTYAFFRLNQEPIKLYPYQDMILNDSHRFKIFRSARQLGKSLSLDIKAARNLCIPHGYNHNECIISKSLDQAKFQMRRVKQLLESAKFTWRDTKGSADNMGVITIDIKSHHNPDKVLFTNMLVIAPCTEGALGYDFHEVNMDETEYWDIDVRYFWNMIIEPTISATKGRITSFSNPNGSDTYIAELENLRFRNGQKKYHVYVFEFLDRPGNTIEELEEHRAQLNRQELESQYLAIRSLSDRNWFTAEEIEKSYDPALTELSMIGHQPFFFLDVGAKHDRSVLVGGYVTVEELGAMRRPICTLHVPIIHCYPVGYPISRVVGSYDAQQDTDGWHIEKSVKDYLKEWSADGTQPVFGVDVTGNSGISPLFQSCDISPTDITFSGPVKSGLYQRYKYYMEKGLLKRIKNKIFEYEAAHLIMTKSKRGYLMIHHDTENDRDDTCFAAGTMIKTARGDISIENLTINDMILTRRGYKPIIAITKRKANVITKFGITATPNHPFITKDGIEKFKYINVSTRLYIWNEKQSCIMEGCITDIPNQNINNSKNIIGHTKKVENAHNHYIDRNGLITLAKSQKDIQFITLMEIRSIMNYQTLNASIPKSIYRCICNVQNERLPQRKLLLNMEYLQQERGINLRKGEHGIVNIGKILLGKFNRPRKSAKFAGKNILQKRKKNQDFVHCDVKTIHANGLKESAKFAEKLIFPERINSIVNIAAGSVCGSETVYNLQIKDCSEYFANNILVHNCDAVAGLICLTDNPTIITPGITIL